MAVLISDLVSFFCNFDFVEIKRNFSIKVSFSSILGKLWMRNNIQRQVDLVCFVFYIDYDCFCQEYDRLGSLL